MKSIEELTNFTIDGYDIRLEYPIGGKFYQSDDVLYYDNDVFLIYLSGKNKAELVNKIKKEILDSILMYMQEDDENLSSLGFDLKTRLLDQVVYCRPSTENIKNIAIIPNDNSDDDAKRLQSYLLKTGKYDIKILSGAEKRVGDLSPKELNLYLSKIEKELKSSKKKITAVIFNVPTFSDTSVNYMNIQNIYFILKTVYKCNICIVTSDPNCDEDTKKYLRDINFDDIINIEDIVSYDIKSEFSKMLSLLSNKEV